MTPGTTPGTFSAALEAQLRADAARPMVTFYDDATGERVELSVTTYANWVAKTAGLVQDELDLERGDRVHVNLPTHWLGAVWLGAAWSVGLEVTATGAEGADLVVCGPDGVAEHTEAPTGSPVVALSLLPLGGRFIEPLPTGVVDYGAVVLGQPDAFMALDQPAGTDAAWSGLDGSVSQDELLGEASRWDGLEPGGRLLSDVAPSTRVGATALAAAVVSGGSLVLVRNPDEALWKQRYDDERATTQLRA